MTDRPATKPRTESDLLWWSRRLFDYIDTDAIIQREKIIARDPMRPARDIVGLTLETWEKFVRPRLAAAIEAEAAQGAAPEGQAAQLLRKAMLAEFPFTGKFQTTQLLDEALAEAAQGAAPHPLLVKYGLESMAGDPIEVLHRHLTNNHAATIGGYKLALERAKERMEASEGAAPRAEGLGRCHDKPCCAFIDCCGSDECRAAPRAECPGHDTAGGDAVYHKDAADCPLAAPRAGGACICGAIDHRGDCHFGWHNPESCPHPTAPRADD